MVIRRFNAHTAFGAIVGLAALFACGMAAADPPGRVARMANIGGPVSFSPAGEDEWVLATPNRPLITGDRVWADAGARAELQIGPLAVRLGSQTSVTILNLDDRVAQFQLEQGALNIRVRRIDPGQTIEIDTPLLAFSLSRPGVYRIDVDAASAATTIAVRSGEGQAYGDGAAYTISERQWYRFADSALRDYQYDALPQADAFDAWSQDRDRREDSPVAARYVSPDVIGYSDLDEYGTWSTVEGYGNVWVPTKVASDWAPYHQGHWAWIEPWGWTWVDDAAWGFAPFHYGRWAYARERWCWVPGPQRARAVYAPALVAFIGGSNFRVTVGAGGPARGIAWFPLAPGEVYRPSYQVSRNYFTNVNVSNTNITNTYITNIYNKPDAANIVYRNRDQRGGVTAMPAAAFVQSRPVAQSAVPVSREIATAGPVTAVASIAPVRASVMGGGNGAPAGGTTPAGPGTVRQPPTTTAQRPVIARVAPPPVTIPFSAREAMLAKDPGRPAAPAAVVAARPATTLAPNVPVVKVVKPAATGTPPPAPTAPRARTNATPPGTGAPPGAGGGRPAPVPPTGVAPASPPKPGAATPAPQPPVPAAPPKPPTRPEIGAVPKADTPPPTPPAGRTPAPPEPATTVPQPPRPPAVRPAPSPPPPGAQPAAVPTPAPAEPKREPPQSPMTNRPAVTPTPPAVEMRREPPPPPAPPAPPVARPPAPPSPPPAEIRREPPAAPAPAVAKPPAPPAPPPAEMRREVRPAPQEAPKPPIVQPAPAPVPVAPPPPAARQPEPKPKAEPAKGEPKAKPDEKRDEPK
jgi:hypothetical protein